MIRCNGVVVKVKHFPDGTLMYDKSIKEVVITKACIEKGEPPLVITEETA